MFGYVQIYASFQSVGSASELTWSSIRLDWFPKPFYASILATHFDNVLNCLSDIFEHPTAYSMCKCVVQTCVIIVHLSVELGSPD